MSKDPVFISCILIARYIYQSNLSTINFLRFIRTSVMKWPFGWRLRHASLVSGIQMAQMSDILIILIRTSIWLVSENWNCAEWITYSPACLRWWRWRQLWGMLAFIFLRRIEIPKMDWRLSWAVCRLFQTDLTLFQYVWLDRRHFQIDFKLF